MFSMETIPRSLCRWLAEGFRRLIHHLTGLADDVRDGLVAAVTRTLSESVEGVLHGVIRGRARPASFALKEFGAGELGADGLASPEWPDSDDDRDDPRDEDSERKVAPQSSPGAGERIPSASHSGRSFTLRLALATALSGLATWLGSSWLTSLATAASVLAGVILLTLS